MEFLRSLLRRRFGRAQVATSGNVSCGLLQKCTLIKLIFSFVAEVIQGCVLMNWAKCTKELDLFTNLM